MGSGRQKTPSPCRKGSVGDQGVIVKLGFGFLVLMVDYRSAAREWQDPKDQ